MTLSDIRWGSVAIAVLLLVIIGLSVTVKLQSSHNAILSETNTRLTQQRDEAQAVTDSVIATTTLFNDIARATQDDNEQSEQQSEQRVVVIRQAIKTDSCSAQPVPSAAADSLRSHRDAIRNGKASADPGKSDG
ncbi:DUF2570 domain-containing protein [Pantoea sp. BAV 3049]|uniref:DUF2570 domain-containing protein n=1 Tax=Pantoea sp. BAV 3049 TaxID=2654188 RepID=UPI00131B9131|nr:DUF2570 domain-containing protein [Pantoea sp. BAV 3049]